jgi:hypothetical protein
MTNESTADSMPNRLFRVIFDLGLAAGGRRL